MLWPIAGNDLGEQPTICMQDNVFPLVRSSQSPSADPANVFRKHFANLLIGIQLPDRLAAILYANGLIGRQTKENVTTFLGPVVERSMMLLNPLESTILVSSDQKSTMLSLCTALEESCEPSLREIAAKMRICITGKCPTPLLLGIMR